MGTAFDALGLQPPRQLEYARMIQPRSLDLLADVARKRKQIKRRPEPYLMRIG